MGKTYVLDRVAADLARGCTHPAIQRLSSLVAAYPHDLDLRRRLAAVHRRVGNRVQAGRWDYLTIGADSRDTRAFERAFPSAVARLRKVRWPHRASQAATAYARSRLAKLMAAAEAEQPGAAATPRSRPSGTGSRPGTNGVARADREHPGNGTVTPLAPPWAPSRLSGRSRRFATILIAVAALVTAPLVMVGVVTVVQWIVQ